MTADMTEPEVGPRRFSPWLGIAVALTLLAWVGTLGVYFGGYDRLVEQVPIHWGWGDQPDGFVLKAAALPYLLIGPGVMVLMLMLTFLLPWLSPRSYEVDRFLGVFQFVMAQTANLFGYIQLMLLLAALGAPVPMPRSLVAGIFLFFAILGNVLGKVRRNFWVGVRTPWTLASEKVWNATHRLSAWVFLGLGLAGFAAVLAGVNLVIVMVVFFAVIAWPIVYSLILYKRLERAGQL